MEDRLKKFAGIVDYGSFTLAAKHLHTSQPALTASIQKLERELHAELFIHGSRPLTLTPAGRIAYEQGKNLQASEQNLFAELTSLNSKKQPLRIGSIDSVAAMLVKAHLLDELEQYSEVSLHVHNSTSLINQLKRGEIDLAIVVGQPTWPKLLERKTLGEEQFTLVCTESYREAMKPELARKNIPNLLSYNMGSTTQKLIASELNANGYSIAPRFHSTNPNVLLQLAVQGKGIAALPQSLVNEQLKSKLVELDVPVSLHRSIVLLTEQGRRFPPHVQEFAKALSAQLT